jgi:class 3 adenylate cyclase/tetratricopeptide (TPR) repeat protein
MTTGGHERVDDLDALDRAIASLEGQRAVLGDEVVDVALASMRERREALASRQVEQRRLVTVLFADLVGFTFLADDLDPEDTRAVVDTYFARWRRIIEEHGGEVEKFIGDAVMAVFGLRRSYEDDAERAVRASMAMLVDLQALNAELAASYDLTLRMRVGIDTGDVVVSTLGRGDGAFVAVGSTVNRAARIQAAAPVDGVLVSDSTQRQVRRTFNLERRDAQTFKGFDEPVDTFAVISERPRTFRPDRGAAIEGVETETVGRASELGDLEEHLYVVAEARRWRFLTVVGDAGVGKSRLLEELDARLSEHPMVVWWFGGRASPSGRNRPLGLLRDVLSNRFGIAESDDAEGVLAKLVAGLEPSYAGTDVTAHVGETAAHDAHLVGAFLGFEVGAPGPGVPTDPQALRVAGTVALAEYFGRLADRNPVLVQLEDLHWADDGSLRWLETASSTLQDKPVLFVGTTRPQLLEERRDWGAGEHHVRMWLQPLARDDARRLVLDLLQRVHDVPLTLVDRVLDAAGGNPFYVEELVTWLVDAGVIVRDEPHWRVKGELADSVEVPSSLRGVLQARLDALDPLQRSVIQRASVLGRVYWDAAVDHLADQSVRGGTVDVGRVHDELRRRELVFERSDSTFASAREFVFRHGLLRDVAYDGVLRAHRERYHRLAGEWVAETAARVGREDEFAAVVADHLDKAADPGAGAWYLRAGQQAASVHALEEASRLLGRTLELADRAGDDLLRFEALVSRERVSDYLGDRAAQQSDLATLEDLLARLPDDDDQPRRRTAVLIAKARVDFALGNYASAEADAGAAAGIAAGAGLGVVEAEAVLVHGKSLTWRGAGGGALESLTYALELARHNNANALVAETLRYLSMLANNEGRLEEALSLAGESAAQFRADGDLEGEAMALAQGGATAYNLGRLREARAALEHALPIFRRSGHRYREAVVRGNLAAIVSAQGEYGAARAWLHEAIDTKRRLQDMESLCVDLLILGLVEGATGGFDAAIEALEEARHIGASLEGRSQEIDAHSRLALVHLNRGDIKAAKSSAKAAVKRAGSAASPLDLGTAHLAAGYVAMADNNPRDAFSSFSEARRHYTIAGSDVLAREARAGTAAAQSALGHHPPAVAAVEALLPTLQTAGVEGSLRPTGMLLHVWQVLRDAGDPRAAAALRRARRYLARTAERIGDDEMAAGFLALPVNRVLLGG